MLERKIKKIDPPTCERQILDVVVVKRNFCVCVDLVQETSAKCHFLVEAGNNNSLEPGDLRFFFLLSISTITTFDDAIQTIRNENQLFWYFSSRKWFTFS